MRVLVHCIYFPPEVGGLESHVHFLCRGLVERGHSVSVVTSRSQPDLPVEDELDGIRIYRTWMPSRTPAGWTVHGLGSTAATRREARQSDIIHAQAFQSIVPCALARMGRSTPLVATLHTSHFLKLAERRGIRPGLHRLVKVPDYNLAASIEIAQVAEALGPGVTVEALANGVDTTFFRPQEPTLPKTPGRVRLIAPRRLFQKNGVKYLIRALPSVLNQLEADLLIVGDGPERGRLESLVDELEIRESVTFLGARPHEDMPGLLSSADLAVFPSLMEATSVAALESMACELPVAASNVGGLPEIVDDQVGALFPPSDPEGIAEAILGLTKDGQLETLGRRARNRVTLNWSNDRLVDRHLEIYQSLLTGEAQGADGPPRRNEARG
ncbi:MAG: glycosyltransferase family 4 protein [Longimicrobiales bacterium]